MRCCKQPRFVFPSKPPTLDGLVRILLPSLPDFQKGEKGNSMATTPTGPSSRAQAIQNTDNSRCAAALCLCLALVVGDKTVGTAKPQFKRNPPLLLRSPRDGISLMERPRRANQPSRRSKSCSCVPLSCPRAIPLLPPPKLQVYASQLSAPRFISTCAGREQQTHFG